MAAGPRGVKSRASRSGRENVRRSQIGPGTVPVHVACEDYDGRSVPIGSTLTWNVAATFGPGCTTSVSSPRRWEPRGLPAAMETERDVGVAGSPGGHEHGSILLPLVIRYPQRVLNWRLQRDLFEFLERLPDETPDELARRLSEGRGFRPVPVRTIQEAVDCWHGDFRKWLGGPSGVDVGLSPP